MKPINIKINNLFLIFISLFLCITPLSSLACSDANPCLIQNNKKNNPLVKNFRDSSQIAQIYIGNIRGLSHLWLSGSGQVDEGGWQTIANKIKKTTKGQVKNMVDLDLRQEPHGYLNKTAISLMTPYNWINLGKTKQVVLQQEKDWLKSLKKKHILYNLLTTKEFKERKFSQQNTIFVNSVQSEKEVVKKFGFKYLRLTVTDHRAPLDSEVDDFIYLIKTLPKETWLHVHCAGGDGRTTTFMAMYDMLKNADRVSFNEIIKRQAAVSPYYNLAKTIRKKSEYSPYYQARLEFLNKFYLYARAYLKGYSHSWSYWKSTN